MPCNCLQAAWNGRKVHGRRVKAAGLVVPAARAGTGVQYAACCTGIGMLSASCSSPRNNAITVLQQRCSWQQQQHSPGNKQRARSPAQHGKLGVLAVLQPRSRRVRSRRSGGRWQIVTPAPTRSSTDGSTTASTSEAGDSSAIRRSCCHISFALLLTPRRLLLLCCSLCSLRDYIGFCLGLSSILFWIVAQVRCRAAAASHRSRSSRSRRSCADRAACTAVTARSCRNTSETTRTRAPRRSAPGSLQNGCWCGAAAACVAAPAWVAAAAAAADVVSRAAAASGAANTTLLPLLSLALQGDTFNLLGALLQGQQLPTTLYTAM